MEIFSFSQNCCIMHVINMDRFDWNLMVLTMLMAFTGPMLLTNISVWITVGLTAKEQKGIHDLSCTASNKKVHACVRQNISECHYCGKSSAFPGSFHAVVVLQSAQEKRKQ